jgi:hypothetical protein
MPNFFLLNGPFAPINSLAVPASLEDQVGYLIKLMAVIAADRRALAPTERATAQFVADLDRAVASTTYALCDSWYQASEGRTVVWPWSRARHREQFATFEAGEFETFPMSPASAPVAVNTHGPWVNQAERDAGTSETAG